ncbi:Plant intracellular Ras-group-related LRR protein 4 [Rhynchospora pubera]|uniref:Plant intracellular Ras-group-related LRR protein 4 n=1 Tax=Rhynchospora pubera TaxID=906938 RepID=A0AAV8BW30_9POAL|nr:Plant intracellular Ras-group-related LRR protein 4 [Rhynchospora pubera]KAJ4799593.1 Plant intracellular Ras-group-related LRR protein 4 [Rhynchospora pubera]
MGTTFKSVDSVIQEVMRLHRSLPPRPSIDEVEAAMTVVRHVEMEENSRIEAILKQQKGIEVPEELFFVVQEMQKNLVHYQSNEQKRDALKLIDLENLHVLFDEMIQRASSCAPSSSNGSARSIASWAGRGIGASGTSSNYSAASASSMVKSVLDKKEGDIGKSTALVTRDDSYVKKGKVSMYPDGIAGNSLTSRVLPTIPVRAPTASATSGEAGDKLNLIQVASKIEICAKKGLKELILQNKLSSEIEWLPDSIGKLSGLTSLDLSENRLVALPITIGGLVSLQRLDLSGNQLSVLPDSIGDLFNLLYLDLKGNQLSSLPSTIGKLVQLEELNLSSNELVSLPDSIGNLIRLKKLIVETNNLEELPYTIGNCVALTELRVDYNRLRGLPEAIGKIESLEVLSVRYNNLKGLPTTMASLPNIKEINVSFNEVESVPESLCLATTLVKLNIGNNFADLRTLPRSIGNLENLEELDISNNQIRFLPDSFGMLTKLRVLRAQQNPLEVPPRNIAEMGAQAVVQYMAEHVAKRDVKSQPAKTNIYQDRPKGSPSQQRPIFAERNWSGCCIFPKSSKRKHNRLTTAT